MEIKIDLADMTEAELAILCSMNIGNTQRDAALITFKTLGGLLSKKTAKAVRDAIEMVEETL